MSWVEDARKLMQDFVAPELRQIATRIDGLKEQLQSSEKSSADRFSAMEKSAADRFNLIDKTSAERHNTLLDKLEAMRREIGLEIQVAVLTSKLKEAEEKQQGSATQ